MKKIIFFDLDGTLLNSSLRYHRIHKEICLLLQIEPMSEVEYWSCKRKKLKEKEILQRCGLGNKTSTLLLNRRKDILESENYLLLDKLHTGVALVLDQLKVNYSLVIVTFRHKRDELLRQLRWLKIADFFDAILNCESKTSPRYFAKSDVITSWLNGRPCEGWLFGDTETDLLAAKELGLKSVAIPFGIREGDLLNVCDPDYFIDSWNTSSWEIELKRELGLLNKD